MDERNTESTLVGSTVDDLTDSATARPPAEPRLPPALADPLDLTPERLGRFILMEEVGAGAMGTVYSAYDPQLDRRVAVKILYALGTGDQQRRLLREARALARLSHPNVVQVYEAGTQDGFLWMAMEFVAGETLAQWNRATRRPWREVLEVYDAVGQGLAAAHTHGVLHRDFKPHNVIVAADGRPRVIDFGLARRAGDAEGPAPAESAESAEPAGPRPASELTGTGAILGTPAYMSPEQFRGERATAASDQFAFCIALYEALFGADPFPRDARALLQEAVLSGAVRQPEPGDTPPWLVELVMRGLAHDPADRWPSMRALLDAWTSRLESVDLASGIGAQAFWLTALIIAAVVGVVTGLADRLPPLGTASIGGATAGLFSLFVWGWLRYRGAETRFNRLLLAWLTVHLLASAASRAVFFVTDQSPTTAYLVDQLILGALSALAAVAGIRWAREICALMVASVAVALLVPDRLRMSVHAFAMTLALLLMAWRTLQGVRRQRAGWRGVAHDRGRARSRLD